MTTISKLALSIFKNRYPDNYKQIPLIKNKTVYNYLQKAFFGGYTQVFKPYEENLNYYDINSHYPACALHNIPTGGYFFTTFPKIPYENKPVNYMGVYSALVWLKICAIGYEPFWVIGLSTFEKYCK